MREKKKQYKKELLEYKVNWINIFKNKKKIKFCHYKIDEDHSTRQSIKNGNWLLVITILCSLC